MAGTLQCVIVEPGRPEGPLVISDIQSDSVYLSWKPSLEDGGGTILGYLIEAKDVLHMDIRKTYIWLDGQETECRVLGLQTSHIYQFRVYAQNEVGHGEALLNKKLVRIKAATKKPPSPSKPLIEITGEESVFLKWTVPEGFTDLNFIVERYEPKSGLWMQCNREMLAGTSYMVNGLMPDKEYKFRISSENVHGVGLPSVESEPVILKESEGELPNITVPVTDCYLQVNNTAFFTCEYTGTQPLLVSWSKDGIRVREGLGTSICTEGGKSSLRLEEIDSDDDECSVQCDLRNSGGKASSRAKIKIFSPPKIHCSPSYKEGLTYDEGDDARLKVTFMGKPHPRIRWLFNGKEPIPDNRISTLIELESIEVRICRLCHADTGIYTFVAENAVGEDFLAVQLTVTGPPCPPSDFKIEQRNELAFLKWNAPVADGGSSVFKYLVEIKKPKNDDEWHEFSTVHDTFISITNLAVLQCCALRIVAVNIYGRSEPSPALSLPELNNDALLESCNQLRIDTGTRSTIDVDDKEKEEISDISGLPELSSGSDNANVLDETVECRTASLLKDVSKVPSEQFVNQGNSKYIISTAEEFIVEPLMNVLFVATQTLISSPAINYACLDMYDFDEISHFAAEVISQEEYPIQVIDNIFCYITGYIEAVLENAFPEYFTVANSNFRGKNSLVLVNCSLINFEAFYFDNVSNLHADGCPESKLYFIGDKQNTIYAEEQVVLSSLGFEHFVRKSNETEFNFSCEIRDYVTVFVAMVFEVTNILEVSENLSRSISITHIPEELETLAGLKCVPMTLFKPALSVLPTFRPSRDEPRENKHVLEATDFTEDEVESEIKLLTDILYWQSSESICHFDSFDNKIMNNVYVCDKCRSVDICVCRYLIGNSCDLISETNYTDSCVEFSTENKIHAMDSETDHSGSSSVINNIPEWLRYVSPNTSKNENISKRSLFESESTSVLKEMSAIEVGKNLFKDGSVQDLLDLAEEVERSFTQKAEQMESLENILHEELNSLEKDLEVVHTINQNLWNDPSLKWTDVDSLDPSVPGCNTNISLENDLIDFKEEAPMAANIQIKHDGYAPEVITHLQDRVVQCRCRTRLYCSISGNPNPQIVWLKNGKLLPPSSRYVCCNLDEFGSYIDIYNAKSTDSGEFTCVATNCHGSAQTLAYLRVVGHREYSPEEPKFLNSPDDVFVQEGDSITLEWKISGTPVPHVVWFKNAEKVETSLRVDTFSNHRGCCRLILRDVTSEDSAIYSCYLENQVGSSVSTVLVSVTDTNVTDWRDLVSTVSDANSLLDLTDDSYIPSLQYFERLFQDASSNDTLIRIKEARTPAKKSTRNPPGPPFAPCVMSSGVNWVILRWYAPTCYRDATSFLLFRVEKKLLDSETWKEVGQTRSCLYTVYGLQNGQSYVFRVTAGNTDGWGPPAIIPHPVHCGKQTCTMLPNDQ